MSNIKYNIAKFLRETQGDLKLLVHVIVFDHD